MSKWIPSGESGDGYRVAKQPIGVSADVYQGNIPTWMTAGGVGTVTAYDASSDGGYIELNPGTTSGDKATLSSDFFVDTAAYAAIEISIRFSLSTTTRSELDASINLLDSGDDDGIQYGILANSGDLDNSLRKVVSGSTTAHSVKSINDTEEHEATLRLDFDSGRAHLWIDGFPANTNDEGFDISDVPRNDIDVVLFAKSGGATTAPLFKVYDFSLRYLQATN